MNIESNVRTIAHHIILLPEHNCATIEDYIGVGMMDRVGSWGTDLELFLAAQLLKTDIFVFKDMDRCWNKFSVWIQRQTQCA